MNDNQPVPRLNPEALKEERHLADLGTDEESLGYDHISHKPGHAPADDTEPIRQPIGGATPPAR
jgi:hypothetical protein